MKYILLTQGKVAKVCDCHYATVIEQGSWCINTGGYAICSYKKNHPTLMHRLITDAPKGLVVDHIDDDRLNNSCDNLRICSQGQNTANMRLPRRNKSGYKGVSWHKATGRYQAVIGINGRLKWIGSFADPIEAAIAYNLAAESAFGEYARLNAV